MAHSSEGFGCRLREGEIAVMANIRHTAAAAGMPNAKKGTPDSLVKRAVVRNTVVV